MTAPILAVGDGALGLWKSVRGVFPATKEQRRWFHKQANVLAALPKSAPLGRFAAMREIVNAADIAKAQVAANAFELDYGAKFPKAERQDHRRPRCAGGVLQISRRALGASAHHQLDRVDLRHRAIAH
jgi:hypothetical protein